MKIKHQLSIATLLMTGVFVTGCSQQSAGGSQIAGGSQQQVEGGSQVSGSQQQVDDAPVVAQEIMQPKEAQPIMAPKTAANPWNHAHPEAPACAQTKSHAHKYSKNGAAHSHNYGCQPQTMAKEESQVDVRALQLKLQAKGYYKGPIDGVVGPSTRNALQRFMKR